MITLHFHCTSFVDLLGLSRPLLNLGSIFKDGLEREAATPLVRKSIGAILSMRMILEDWIEAFEDHDRQEQQLESLPSEVQELFRQSTACNLKAQWFTDCALIDTDFDLKRPLAAMRGLLGQFAGLANGQLMLLLQQQLLRGGIEIGHGAELDSGEVIGSSGVVAYKLESEVASYPRIVVGKELWTVIEQLQAPGVAEGVAEDATIGSLLRAQSSYIKSFLRIDHDDLPIIDPVSRPVINSMVKDDRLPDWTHALEQLQENLDDSFGAGDLKLYSKLKYAEKTLVRGSEVADSLLASQQEGERPS